MEFLLLYVTVSYTSVMALLLRSSGTRKYFTPWFKSLIVFGIPDFLSETVPILEDNKIFVINTSFM